MARCNSCNRWAQIEPQDAEVNNLEYHDGHVTFDVVIENNCAECNQTLTRAEFSFDEEVEFAHECEFEEGETPEFEPSVEAERFEQEEPPKAKRRKKFYGVSCDIKAVCSCGYETPVVTASDRVQASSMDDAQ